MEIFKVNTNYHELTMNSVNAREFTRTLSGTWMLNQMPGWSGVLEGDTVEFVPPTANAAQ